MANAGSVEDARSGLTHGAEGIGLLRTEFLFLDRNPDEAEQFAAYSAIFSAMAGRETVVRTMDLGGDKPPPYLDFGEEANPFLGWRGLRVALDRPDMLRTQVRALLRAALGGTVHIMFPMVSTLNELQRARSIVDAARQQLEAEKIPSASEVKVGIMVEVPAAALMANVLAPHVDFFSIGTNDLTQYTMAVDRGASRVAHLYSAVQPAVLRLIAHTVEAAHQAGKWVGMCGEAAGNPELTALWLGLGLDELSMSPASIPAVKEATRRIKLDVAQALTAGVLQQSTLEDVEAMLRTSFVPLDSPGAAD
jgi:phosphoenolpyruvate-protein phosphotransferase